MLVMVFWLQATDTSLSNLDKKKWECLGGSVNWTSDSWFRLRSWSHSTWDGTPRWALCWQYGACLGFSISLSLCTSPPLTLAISPQINKQFFLRYWKNTGVPRILRDKRVSHSSRSLETRTPPTRAAKAQPTFLYSVNWTVSGMGGLA